MVLPEGGPGMRILVTGSSGHLGEALVRTLREMGHELAGLDLLPGPFTSDVGSVADRDVVQRVMRGCGAVFHAAALHKPHVVTHARTQFVHTNITGTLTLLEEAATAGVGAFVFTSTTSTFGDALVPPAGAPAAWITEDIRAVPKNIYGVTKLAAEDLCQIVHRNLRLPVIVLRTSRFFAGEDDRADIRAAYASDNSKVNEFLYRRVEIEDAVAAQLCAMERAAEIGFGRYIISAATPFREHEMQALRDDAPAVVRRHVPEFEAEYARLGWRMLPSIDRVYVSAKAVKELGWRPKYDFRSVVAALAGGEDFRSPVAQAVGSKPYHAQEFADGPYPVEEPLPRSAAPPPAVWSQAAPQALARSRILRM